MAVLRPLLTVLLAYSSVVFGQDLEDALQRLSQRVGKRPVNLSWQNQSTMPPEEAEVAQHVLPKAVADLKPLGETDRAVQLEWVKKQRIARGLETVTV